MHPKQGFLAKYHFWQSIHQLGRVSRHAELCSSMQPLLLHSHCIDKICNAPRRRYEGDVGLCMAVKQKLSTFSSSKFCVTSAAVVTAHRVTSVNLTLKCIFRWNDGQVWKHPHLCFLAPHSKFNWAGLGSCVFTRLHSLVFTLLRQMLLCHAWDLIPMNLNEFIVRVSSGMGNFSPEDKVTNVLFNKSYWAL